MSAGHPTDRPAVAYALATVAALATLSPLARGVKDDFPLSPYPMFSTAKDPRAVVDHAVLVRADGSETILSPRDLGTDEVLQAEAVLTGAVRRGKPATQELCATLAARIGARSEGDAGARPASIEIRSVVYDSGAYLADPTVAPTKRTVRARCEVKGS